MKETTINRETRYCPWCEQHQPIEEFYTRKKGLQAGLPAAYCKVCNTDAVRYRTFMQMARNGKLDAHIESLEQRLVLAKRAKAEVNDTARHKLALEIGLKILAERDAQEKVAT